MCIRDRDLEVIDAYTGGARAVETLSGGELFLASLSLAFGLSDVVQSYSGGVHLDSLFIDEGFGSLDQETLDTAMKALAQLQHMGRTIGIISHAVSYTHLDVYKRQGHTSTSGRILRLPAMGCHILDNSSCSFPPAKNIKDSYTG